MNYEVCIWKNIEGVVCKHCSNWLLNHNDIVPSIGSFMMILRGELSCRDDWKDLICTLLNVFSHEVDCGLKKCTDGWLFRSNI